MEIKPMELQMGVTNTKSGRIRLNTYVRSKAATAVACGGEDGTPAGTRTRAHGLGNRCSIL